MTQPYELTAVAQAAAIRRRELSPVELVEHYLDRIEAYNPALNAFVTQTAQNAREQAKRAEVAVTMREAGLPALHGVPVALKDLTATAGVRTTYGAVPYADHVPDTDAPVVGLLRRAGTISLGKTATSEFGTTLYTENRLQPPARNPWRTDLSPGGSSGGAAVAVAAGLVPFAQGSDGGGSLRVPAALCGLVGVKPSRGLVPGGGGFGLASDGPLARTVADAAALLDAMAVPLPGEPWLAPPVPPEGSYLAALRRETGRLRVASYVDPPLYDTVPHPDCLAAHRHAGLVLEALGHEVVQVPGPYDPGLLADFRIVQSGLVGGRVVSENAAELTPMTRWLAEQGSRYCAREVFAAQARLQAALRRAAAALACYDLVLTPTVAAPSVAIGRFAALSPPEDFDQQTAFSPYCSVYNLSGQPAVSVPVAVTATGLPLAVMLAAPLGADARLLAVAAGLQEAAGYGDRHPPICGKLPSATVNPIHVPFDATRGALTL